MVASAITCRGATQKMRAVNRRSPAQRGLLRRPVLPRNDVTSSVAAAPIGAQPLAAGQLGAHQLAAARAVFQRTKADLDDIADSGSVLRPAERDQLRGRSTLELPG